MPLTWIPIQTAAKRLCCNAKKLRLKQDGEWRYYPTIRRMQHDAHSKVFVCAEDVETFMAQFEQPLKQKPALPVVPSDTIAAIRKQAGRDLAALSRGGAIFAKKLGYL